MKSGTEVNYKPSPETSSKYKDVLELNGHYYPVYLTVNDETGDVIDSETWVEKSWSLNQ